MNKQGRRSHVTLGTLFVAWQPSRMFRTRHEAAAMWPFLITAGEIKVRISFKYLVNYLFF